jgi:hypothetical protein
VNVGNNDIRRRGQTKFITEAMAEGLKWACNRLDDKKNIYPDYDQYVQVTEAPPLTSQELHLSYKASRLMKNINRARLYECLSGMSENDPNYAALIKKIKKTLHFHCKYCAAGCSFKTTEGCVRCNVYVHLNADCWNSYHEKLHNGMKLPKKVVKSVLSWESSLDSTLAPSNVTAVENKYLEQF